MPHGYTKRKDDSKKCVFCKTHRNGEKTKIDIEKIPESDDWFAFVKDEGQTMELGRFATKGEAKTEARNFMQNNPKGLQNQSNSLLPGMDDSGNLFGF